MTPTKDELFKPAKRSPQEKAALTTSVAKTILAAEVAAREAKTERLRALRMEKAQN